MQACTYVPGNVTIDLLGGIPSDRSYISYMCGPARRPQAKSRRARASGALRCFYCVTCILVSLACSQPPPRHAAQRMSAQPAVPAPSPCICPEEYSRTACPELLCMASRVRQAACTPLPNQVPNAARLLGAQGARVHGLKHGILSRRPIDVNV